MGHEVKWRCWMRYAQPGRRWRMVLAVTDDSERGERLAEQRISRIEFDWREEVEPGVVVSVLRHFPPDESPTKGKFRGTS